MRSSIEVRALVMAVSRSGTNSAPPLNGCEAALHVDAGPPSTRGRVQGSAGSDWRPSWRLAGLALIEPPRQRLCVIVVDGPNGFTRSWTFDSEDQACGHNWGH